MRVTLIYPGIGGKGFNSLGQGMDSGWIGHGLAILAACARQAGAEVDLIDLRALPDWETFRSEVARRRPDVVGVSMMSADYNPGMRALEIVRQVNPAIRTCVGGPHPTICLGEVQDSPLIDHIFPGEGEVSFPEALRTWMSGGAVPRIVPPVQPDLDAVPYADHELFLAEWRRWGYALDSPEAPFVPELPAPFVTIIAGRGCIYNCSYCQPAERHIFGRMVRRRSVPNVIAELTELRERYRFNSFMFHDDCLTEDREWVIAFCRAYQEAGFTQPFFCQSRADIIVKNEDMVALMAQAGLRGYLIGFESGSDRVLRFIRKGTKVWQNLRAAEICRKYGIAIWANYMLGLPTETEDEMRATIAMLKKMDPDYYSPAFYTPHPGSDLFAYCEEHGLSLITSHDSYRRNPTEVKIKGHDAAFLQWALAESQRRTLPNRLRRLWRRYARPDKVWRRVRRAFGREA
ncbi:MAG TPA: radical SAM protein [Anaerolineae bacterium]|nr:radical SAM protein [Anaerolineae bacterium]HOQ98456.1 radical SAM protein [Anaerolineae bacterium]HPL26739.1 radical SAM protein [Anaerolineae bacterium]